MDYIHEELERQRLMLGLLLQPAANHRETPQKEEEILRRAAVSRMADPDAFRAKTFAEDAVFVPAAAESVGLSYQEAFAREEAESVSRAVERDARRYDGGYLMY